MIISAIGVATLAFQSPDFKVTPLTDGFVRVESKEYSVEVPKAWTVGNQTPWGARSITPGKGSETELGVMTAGVTKRSWDELYKTSLYFIMRQEQGKATAYRLGKNKAGYESCSFEVLNAEGFAKRKFVLLKSEKGAAIALSVTISEPKDEKQINSYFTRMIDSAKINDPK